MNEDKIRVSNLATALRIAIETLKKREELAWGIGNKSALRAGLESNLEAIKSGKTLRIDYNP